MTMTIDNQQRHHLNSLGYDNMAFSQTPQFTNPWDGAPQSQYNASMGQSYSGLPIPKQQTRPVTMSMPYSSIPATTATVGGTYQYSQPEIMHTSQDMRPAYDAAYTTAPAASSYAATAGTYPPLASYGASLAQHQQEQQTRLPAIDGSPVPQSHASFGDALDGARGMVSLSQTDITPRNIYGPRGDRGSTDSYGFPSTHSSHSSISSASTFPNYFASSVDSSVTDYSSASESLDGMNSRRLPRPSAMMGSSHIPGPQSMMGSFNSKVSSSTQKKHKCKICDKRFTRPSSLQTHMYSHTGEKPFACEVPGCGRQFSVVSNLRRHKKVHKSDRSSDHESQSTTDEHDHGSPEGSWASHD